MTSHFSLGGEMNNSQNHRFTPNTWTVPAGKEITITLTNKGANEHEWVIIKKGETVTVPFDDDDEDKVYWEIHYRTLSGSSANELGIG
jgi:uncharacterized cupredoxin-like copper-binding protein